MAPVHPDAATSGTRSTTSASGIQVSPPDQDPGEGRRDRFRHREAQVAGVGAHAVRVALPNDRPVVQNEDPVAGQHVERLGHAPAVAFHAEPHGAEIATCLGQDPCPVASGNRRHWDDLADVLQAPPVVGRQHPVRQRDESLRGRRAPAHQPELVGRGDRRSVDGDRVGRGHAGRLPPARPSIRRTKQPSVVFRRRALSGADRAGDRRSRRDAASTPEHRPVRRPRRCRRWPKRWREPGLA